MGTKYPNNKTNPLLKVENVKFEDLNLKFPQKVIFGIFHETSIFESDFLKIILLDLKRVKRVIEM